MDRMVTGSTAVLSFVLCAFCLAQEPPQPPQKEPAANQTPEQLYQQLGSGKPSEVFAAMKALSDPGTGAVQFLAGKLQEGFSVGSEEETKIAREKAPDLIALLGNDDFEVREKATQELIALGKAVVPIVTEVLNSSDPEVATRARTVLDEIGKKNSDATRNTLDLLTVSLLGRLGGPEAVKAMITVVERGDFRIAAPTHQALVCMAGDTLGLTLENIRSDRKKAVDAWNKWLANPPSAPQGEPVKIECGFTVGQKTKVTSTDTGEGFISMKLDIGQAQGPGMPEFADGSEMRMTVTSKRVYTETVTALAGDRASLDRDYAEHEEKIEGLPMEMARQPATLTGQKISFDLDESGSSGRNDRVDEHLEIVLTTGLNRLLAMLPKDGVRPGQPVLLSGIPELLNMAEFVETQGGPGERSADGPVSLILKSVSEDEPGRRIANFLLVANRVAQVKAGTGACMELDVVSCELKVDLAEKVILSSKASSVAWVHGKSDIAQMGSMEARVMLISEIVQTREAQ
jgi:hypothetical protein